MGHEVLRESSALPHAAPRHAVGAMLSRLFLGRYLRNRENDERKIGAFEGVPAMGLDGLGSSAYGPEAALTVMIPLGAAGLAHLGPLMLLIVALLAILYVSYRQTVAAYPSNGGAYTVSKENLGTRTSLLAAAALMIDYVLNVAVGISAGVAALVSAVPSLQPYTLALCLGILAAVTLVNLRGTLDAGRLFALPTYTFVASFIGIMAYGVVQAAMAGGHPQPVVPPPALPDAAEAVSLWLLVRAFSSGCTAMTGVEAVSNGVGAFREPVVTYARRTLTAIVVVLGLLLLGVGYLAQVYGVGAMDQTKDGYQSVLSQLTGAIVGRGVVYHVAIGSLLCVLALSANTSFTDFPRLCRLVAQDGFLPKPFAVVGRRLVYSVGILYLAATSGLLLVAFGGITDRLIPLFAIGAFLTFTLSQAGMVIHWRRERLKDGGAKNDGANNGGARNGVRLAVNLVGALTTGIALAVIIVAKFTEGAWITIVVIPLVIALLSGIGRYYANLNRTLRKEGPIDLSRTEPPIVLVASEGWNRLTDKAIGFAAQLSRDVIAVHLTSLSGPDDTEGYRQLREEWRRDVEEPAKRAGICVPRLVLLQAPFRRIHVPILKFVDRIRAEHPDRTIAVLVPGLVKTRWWQYLLHLNRSDRLRSALLRYGSSKLVVIDVPWHLDPPQVGDAFVEEERGKVREPAPA